MPRKKATADAELLAYRELDETLGLTAMSEEMLHDSRPGSNKQHELVSLLQQCVYSLLAGYEDVNGPGPSCEQGSGTGNNRNRESWSRDLPSHYTWREAVLE
ncbi:MAG: transposase [Planctomycetales bacterium]